MTLFLRFSRFLRSLSLPSCSGLLSPFLFISPWVLLPSSSWSFSSLHFWQRSRDHHARVSTSPHNSLPFFSAVLLKHLFRGWSSADLIWSVHLIGNCPSALVPSIFPCTTRHSIFYVILPRELSEKEVSMWDWTIEERRCLITSSWRITLFVRKSVHDNLRIILQHHIYTFLAASMIQRYGEK